MKANKEKNRPASAMDVLVGLVCALVLGAVFYGAMAYQLTGEDKADASAAQHKVEICLALPGEQLVSEQRILQEFGGETCTALVRVYALPDGTQAEAVCASPAAYIERLAVQGYAAQPVTGYALAGLDAVYSIGAQDRILSARTGDTICMLRAAVDERTLYALGTAATLE